MDNLHALSKAELIERVRRLEARLGAQGENKTNGHNRRRSDGGREDPSAQTPDRYADLYNFAPVGYVSVDENGRIEDINVTGAAMLGWEPGWLLGQAFKRWVVKDDVETFARHLGEVRAANGKVIQELRIKSRQGWPLDVRLESVPVRRAEDETLTCRSAILDISERKRAEHKARTLQSELAHATRLSTVGEMASSLAHELNQPLGAIALYCGASLRMARTGAVDVGKLVTALSQACEAAEYAGGIIHHLRAFLRKSGDHRADVEVNEMICEVVRLTEPSARDNETTLRLELNQDSPWVTVDRIHVEQAVLNLIHNSIEAMSAARSPLREVTISAQRAGEDELRVSVRDTGPGLREPHCAHLFEPFFTTKSDGMGLGLSVSRSIVELYGGSLWAESNGHRGAQFHFTLPLSAQDDGRRAHDIPGR